MPTPTLSEGKKQQILKLHRQGLRAREVAAKAGVGLGTVSNIVRQAALEAITQTPQDAHERFCDLRDEYRKLIGWDGKTNSPPPSPKGGERKIIVLNDLHCPAHDREALAHILRMESQNSHLCIIAGDGLDNWNVSKYPKAKRPWSPKEELREFTAMMLSIAEAFPEVWVMSGNHDTRFLKLLQRRGIEPEIIQYLETLAPNVVMNPLARMTEGMANVKIVEPARHDFAEFPHIFQLNDLILSHAEKFSRVAQKAVADVVVWLKKFCEPLGIVQPFRVVGHAHTHQAGLHYDGYGVVAMEMGCLARLPDYAGNEKLMGADKPPVIGYSIFYQIDGKTDLSRSRFVPLRWGKERMF